LKGDEEMVKFALLLCGTLLFTASAVAQKAEDGWLDRPLSNWNNPNRPIERAMPTGETIAEMAKRCDSPLRQSTEGERALANAGWLPFRPFDRQILQRDVEILGGMAEADGMCRPQEFNIFVFVKGELAGTLSPALMASRTDGAVGAIRLADDDTIAAEVVRYLEKDALCCPSSRVTVRYRIDRTAPRPVVVPVSVQVTRPPA
jgi:hypothetical protein